MVSRGKPLLLHNNKRSQFRCSKSPIRQRNGVKKGKLPVIVKGVLLLGAASDEH